VILTVEGKPVAALVSIENADLETVTLSTHPSFLALIERARVRQKTEGGISNTEMRRKLAEGTEVDEKEWLRAASANPAFDFLKEPEEDIYTLEDGRPFYDQR